MGVKEQLVVQLALVIHVCGYPAVPGAALHSNSERHDGDLTVGPFANIAKRNQATPGNEGEDVAEEKLHIQRQGPWQGGVQDLIFDLAAAAQ
jgi:hypothetical protein